MPDVLIRNAAFYTTSAKPGNALTSSITVANDVFRAVINQNKGQWNHWPGSEEGVSTRTKSGGRPTLIITAATLASG